MSIFARIFRRSANAVVISQPQKSNNDKSWMGFDIQETAPYSLLLIQNEKKYAGHKREHKKDVTEYPSLYEDFVSGVLIRNYYHQNVDNPFEAMSLSDPNQIWDELACQVKGEKLSNVRESGLGQCDLVEISFDLRVISTQQILDLIRYKRDETIFNTIQTDNERELFQFKQTSQPLQITSNQKDNRPMAVVRARDSKKGSGLQGGGMVKNYDLVQWFPNLTSLIDALVNDNELFESLKSSAVVVGIDNFELNKTPLPAELHHRLKREVVLSKLESGPRARLLAIEHAIMQEMRAKILKIPAPDSRDRGNNSVTTEYLSMFIYEKNIEGEILKGKFKNRSLKTMRPLELKEFYEEIKHEPDSKALYEAYLSFINFGDFRERKEWKKNNSGREEKMTIPEACEILGIDVPDENGIISKEKISKAFRKAIKINGHDAGSSEKTSEEMKKTEEITKKIVTARDVLTKRYP